MTRTAPCDCARWGGRPDPALAAVLSIATSIAASMGHVGCKPSGVADKAAPWAEADAVARATGEGGPPMLSVGAPPESDAGAVSNVHSLPSVGALASVKLLDSGRPPRRRLRYAWRLDQKETLAMDLRTAASTEGSLSGSARQPEVPLPTVHLAIALDPQSVSTDGDLRYTWRVSSASVDSAEAAPALVAEGMRAEVADLLHASGSALVTARGVTKELSIESAGSAGEMIEPVRQTLRDIAAPLPEEEIGVGARWRKLSQLDARDARITQTETFRLVDLQGDRGTLDDSLAQTAPPQALHAPGMPAGARVRMESMLGSGDAKVRFDLSRLVPQTAFEGTTTLVLSGQPAGDGVRSVTVAHVFIAIAGSRR